VTRGLLDTSVVIAIATGEELDLPEQGAISTITLCELHHGVLIAGDAVRAQRLNTLVTVERAFEALPIDARVAPHFGRIVADARRKHDARPRVADTLVAATALSHDLLLYTRYGDLARLDIPGLTIV
jgi:predicted nucleic acid-binding protein